MSSIIPKNNTKITILGMFNPIRTGGAGGGGGSGSPSLSISENIKATAMKL